MPLTHCIECQWSISDSASCCPKCSTREPFGVVCELCGERLRRSVGVTSVRQVHEAKYSDSDTAGWWYSDEYMVNRSIVAHEHCLERYYTPPSKLECSDCGLLLASSDLGFDALTLWRSSLGTSHGFTCPCCGAFHSGLGQAPCERTWVSDSPPWKTYSFLRRDPYICMKPLYWFQVTPNGQGHGHGFVPAEVPGEPDELKILKAELNSKSWFGWLFSGVHGVGHGLLERRYLIGKIQRLEREQGKAMAYWRERAKRRALCRECEREAATMCTGCGKKWCGDHEPPGPCPGCGGRRGDRPTLHGK
jgi:hypothetical protein